MSALVRRQRDDQGREKYRPREYSALAVGFHAEESRPRHTPCERVSLAEDITLFSWALDQSAENIVKKAVAARRSSQRRVGARQRGHRCNIIASKLQQRERVGWAVPTNHINEYPVQFVVLYMNRTHSFFRRSSKAKDQYISKTIWKDIFTSRS